MKAKLGFAMTGSFCTFQNVLREMEMLSQTYDITPIMSAVSYRTDTRFGMAEEFRREIEAICGNRILSTTDEVEPLGPKKLLDLLLIAPCTGNTIGKLANGIADSAVTFAVKAHLRNARPVVVAISTNDGLSASAENIGKLLNRKHYYFVPFRQDAPQAKPYSLVADFDLIPETVAFAMMKQQLQPILQ